MISADAMLNKLKRDKRKNSIEERRGLRPTQWVIMLKKWRDPIKITEVYHEGRLNKLSTGRAAQFEIIKHHNPSSEDWCISSDMEKVGYLLMDPACKIYEKGISEKR